MAIFSVFPNDFDHFDLDQFDRHEKKSILSKKVNDLFVDRNVNVVTLQPLRVTKFPLKGNKIGSVRQRAKRDWPTRNAQPKTPEQIHNSLTQP